ncbi:hypothetical protein SKAU_G00284240 [Synaphobranchus kaupii]|uniref:Uncharacterized protein n=1 Tax=Synaphobranchus kaupii TaxID=118154 RepID=A0A9Q1EXW3_SYNKA|nr:hypothetical protein SKAU_G00284240 [Synaphobranchus kaupii]
MQMEQVTSIFHLQIPAQPSPGDPTWPSGDAGPRLAPPQPCEQAGAVLEASVVIFLMVVAGAVILVLGCTVLLLCYRHRWAHSGSLQYINLYHSARYTLKEPCPSPPPATGPSTALPPARTAPPAPALMRHTPASAPPHTPTSPLPPAPRPKCTRPPLHPAPPLIHTTPPSPLLPSADMVVYSRIGLMRTSRPPSASGSATQVILFEHSSL